MFDALSRALQLCFLLVLAYHAFVFSHLVAALLLRVGDWRAFCTQVQHQDWFLLLLLLLLNQKLLLHQELLLLALPLFEHQHLVALCPKLLLLLLALRLLELCHLALLLTQKLLLQQGLLMPAIQLFQVQRLVVALLNQ